MFRSLLNTLTFLVQYFPFIKSATWPAKRETLFQIREPKFEKSKGVCLIRVEKFQIDQGARYEKLPENRLRRLRIGGGNNY